MDTVLKCFAREFLRQSADHVFRPGGDTPNDQELVAGAYGAAELVPACRNLWNFLMTDLSADSSSARDGDIDARDALGARRLTLMNKRCQHQIQK